MDAGLYALPIIAFLAFLLKAVSGFGPAIIVVALGAMILPPHSVVPLSSLLDVTAGSLLLMMDPAVKGKKFLLALSLAMVIGAVLGGFSLRVLSPDLFRYVLGGGIILLSVWFGIWRAGGNKPGLVDTVPEKFSAMDIGMSAFAGFCGGFLGITGPPVLWHLGRRFAKETLRKMLIPIFLAAAVARSLTYAAAGMVDTGVLQCYLVSLPGLFLGIYVGNRVFFRISETTFSRLIGGMLLLAGMRLLIP